jgi:FKBP-type peptidyl-prolyl cis-trans isomerase
MRSAFLALILALSACAPENELIREIERREAELKKSDEIRTTERMKSVDLFQGPDAAAKGVKTTASGLRYVVLESGPETGALTKPTDMVAVHYEGWLLDGKVFDSSYQRGQPQPFQANQLIPAWVEALQLMRPGDRWEIYAPSTIAYGATGAGADIPPNADLVFRLEIVQNMSSIGARP